MGDLASTPTDTWVSPCGQSITTSEEREGGIEEPSAWASNPSALPRLRENPVGKTLAEIEEQEESMPRETRGTQVPPIISNDRVPRDHVWDGRDCEGLSFLFCD